jgi:hypothetical protein
MTITRNGNIERLIIDNIMKRHLSITKRAITCWKAYREKDEFKQILIVKDSWQYREREKKRRITP